MTNVCAQASGVLWDCELNLLDLANNHDKYYNIQVWYRARAAALLTRRFSQVIKAKGGKFYCFCHWGRTGAKGMPCHARHASKILMLVGRRSVPDRGPGRRSACYQVPTKKKQEEKA